MRIANKAQYIILGLFVAFSAFAFSCCNMPISHEASMHMSGMENKECCNIVESSGMVITHNQPLFSPIMFSVVAFIAVLAVFAFGLLGYSEPVKRFILYDAHIRRNKGSTKLFNLFTLIFSKGILHPKVL